jgi:hypothetical protein
VSNQCASADIILSQQLFIYYYLFVLGRPASIGIYTHRAGYSNSHHTVGKALLRRWFMDGKLLCYIVRCCVALHYLFIYYSLRCYPYLLVILTAIIMVEG